MTPEKFVYIPNGVDVQEWISPAALPTEVAAHLDQIVSVGLPIVAYIGTHGLANALDILLDAAHALQGKAQLLLVGTGPERERLLSRVKKEGLANVVMLPSIPKQSIPMLLTLVDIVYLGWHPNPLYRFGISPNKLMDYMMAAKPVIHSVDAGNDPVAEAGCGITVPPGDAAAVANAVLKLIALSPRERQEMGKSGKRFILAKHTYSVLAKQFLDSIFVGQTNR